MCIKFNKTSKMFVDFEAINKIVLGIVCILSTGILNFAVHPVTFFVLGGGIFSVLKGSLLFHGSRKGNRACVLIYLIMNTLFLLALMGLIIFLGLGHYDDLMRYNSPILNPSIYITIYGLMCPVIFIFYWFIEYCVIVFYRSLNKRSFELSELEVKGELLK